MENSQMNKQEIIKKIVQKKEFSQEFLQISISLITEKKRVAQKQNIFGKKN